MVAKLPAPPLRMPFGIIPIVTYNYMMDGRIDVIEHLKDLDNKTKARLLAWKRAAECEI